IYIVIKDRTLLKVDRKGLVYSAILGLVCHAFYNLFMFKGIEHTTITTTVTLLYTSPIFVMLVSSLIFKEKINTNKIIALITCVVGAFLTVSAGDMESLTFNSVGILYGLAAAICFGSMNLINKAIVNDYKELTLLIYTLGFAFVFSLIFSNPLVLFNSQFDFLLYIFVIMTGVLSTAISYLCFMKGLSYGVESGNAAIMATLEVPISVIGAVIAFGQKVVLWEIVGICLVLTSVLIINKGTLSEKTIQSSNL